MKSSRISLSWFLLVSVVLSMAPKTAKGNTYYVSLAGVNPDGLSWETAFTSIQDALDVATQNNDLILITNGAYTASSGDQVMWVTNANTLTVRGLGGGQTVIDGELARRGITMTAAATNVVIEGLTITRGKALQLANLHFYGPAIFMEAGTVRDCIITANTNDIPRSVYGGAVYMIGGLLQDSVISNNRASGASNGRAWGGGVYIDGGVVDRCVIVGNQVSSSNISDGERGGGVYVHAGTLQNSLVYGNTATGALRIPGRGSVGTRMTAGAGVYVHHANGRVLNCTIANNTTIDDIGVGLWMNAGIASNTIVYANSLTFRPESLFRPDHNVHLESGAEIRYSCMSPLVAGDGNIDGAPLFADPDNNDFRLLPGSPAINAGAALGDITVDINGDMRPRDGNGSGAAHDMGALEALAYNEGDLRAGFTLPVNKAFDSLDAVLTAHVAGADTSSLTYWWDFLDDGSETDGGAGKAIVTNSYSYGQHSVRLTVSNATESATSMRSGLIQVGPQMLYVAAGSGNIAPYETPGNAAASLQDALDWTIEVDGVASEIQVGDGDYTLNSQLLVLKNTILRSENGAAATILRQTGSGERVMYIGQFTHGAIIDGFTFTGGTFPGPTGVGTAGIGICMVGDATVRNSIITGNSSARRWVDGAGVYMTAGRLETSEVTANRGSYNNSNGTLYGAGIHMAGGGSIVDRCIVANNTNAVTAAPDVYGGGVYMIGASTLQNTLVYGNVIDGANATVNRGGGVYTDSTASQVLNCTIVDNEIGAGGLGGGVYMNNGYMTNTIVYFNTIAAPQDSHNAFVSASGAGVDYSAITPAVSGTGNTTDQPLFNDRPNQDYTLSSVSTLINAGVILAGVTNDLAGLERPQGDSHDIGAYEALPAGDDLTVGFSADPTQVMESQDVVFSAILGGANTNNVYFRWDFNNNGSIDLEGFDLAVVTNNTYAPGYYTVRVTASNSFEEVAESISVPDFIRVAPAIVYVATGGIHTVPFASPLTAATNLQDAINEALVTSTATSMVLVAAGVYEVTTPVLFNKGITVRSSDGAETTIFRKSDSVAQSRIFEITDANAVLDGFTVRDGSASASANNGAGLWLNAGLVQNCIIIANRFVGRTGWGGGIRINSGGTLRNSLVAGNWVLRNNSSTGNIGAGGIYLVGGRVENCTVVGNWISDETASATQVGSGGIHRDSGTITNTIVYYNFRVDGNGLGNHDLYATAGVGFSCSPDVVHDPVGTGNFTNAPAFFDPGSGYGASHVFGNYRLAPESPCIDTGTTLAWMQGAKDLDGNPRITRGVVDRGAFEAQPPQGSLFMIR